MTYFTCIISSYEKQYKCEKKRGLNDITVQFYTTTTTMNISVYVTRRGGAITACLRTQRLNMFKKTKTNKCVLNQQRMISENILINKSAYYI